MILKQQHNTPVTAPQFSNMMSALAMYRNWRDDQLLGMDSFLKFVTLPSQDRDEFLTKFTPEVTVRNNMYAKVIYS